MYNEKVRWNKSTFKSSSYWKYVSELLLKFDLLCQWNKGGRNWLKILYHGYCHEWRQALNFWLFILKSWIILMKISTVFSWMHVITPLPSTQSKLKSFPNSNSESSLSNVTFNWFLTFFQRSWERGAWVSWPRCTCRMAGDLVWLPSLLETERVSVIRYHCKKGFTFDWILWKINSI